MSLKIMQSISSINELHQLPLQAYSLENLHQLLVINFGSVEATNQYWLDSDTVLWQLDSNDSIPDDPLVEFALQYPECVMHIDDKWYLLLGIVSDSGQGVYVVFPNDTCVPRLQSILAEVTHG